MINFFQGTKRNLVKSVSSMKNGDLAVATDEMRWYIKYNDVLEPLNSNLDQYEASVEQTIERLEEAITYLENLTEGATDDVETATALATNMNNLINEAQSQLSVIEDVAQALNSIKIGGKNLLHNTKSFEQNDIVLTNGEIKEPGLVRLTSTVDNSSCFKYNVNYLNYSEYQNQVYTFSCDVRLAIAPTSFTEDSFRLLLGVNAENHENEIFSSSHDKYTYITLNNSLNTSWQRFSITASVPGGLSYGTSSALVAESNLTVGVEALNSTVPIEIRYPKLEKGNISTDWTPAPEDTSFEIGERNLLQKTESFTALNALIINGEIVEPGLARLIPTNHESYLKYNVDYLDYINYEEQNYTFSCDIRLADIETIYTNNEITLYIGVNSNENRTYIFDNSYDKYAFNVFTNDLSSNWKRFSITKNIPRDLVEGVNEALSQGSNITVQISAKENTVPIEIRRLKLERGTNVSDWTPAPEDLILSIKSILNDLNSINETLDDHSRTITRIDSDLFSKAEAQDVALLTQTVTNISNIVDNLNNNYARIDDNGVIQGGTLDFSKVNGLERYFIRVNDSGVIDNNVTIDFSNVNGLNDHFAQIDENHMLVNAGVNYNNVVGLNNNYAQIIQVNGNNVLANALVDSDDVLGLSENYAGIGPDGSLNSNVKIDSNNVTGLSENYAGIGPDGSLSNNVRIDFDQIDNLSSRVALIENGFLQNAYIDSAQVNDLYSNFAHVRNGYIENATIDYARVTDLQTHYAEIENGYIKNARIDYANVDQLDTHYANIDFANVTEAIIDTAHIKEAAIKSAQIDEAAIKSAHIDEAAIKSAHIDEAAINTVHIHQAAIKSAQIDEGAIETAHIGNGVITSAKIGSGEIKEANIDNAAITTAKIEDAAIISAKIRQGAIENAHIQQAAIDTANIKDAAITTALIRDGAIVDSKIQNLSANKLTAGTINGDVINVTNLNAENLKVKRINGNPVLGGFEAVNKNIVDYENKNPTEESWYEFSNGNFVATVDTEVDVTKTYYKTNNNSVVTFYDKETVDTMFNAVDARIDSQIETFTGDEVPTLFNEPYTIWYQPEEDPPIDIRQEHVGDIYYVISSDPENPSDYDGWTYRFAWDNTQQTYKWVLIKDNQVTAALGEINQLDGSLSSFRTEVSSWKEETDDELESVWQSHNNLSGVVNKTVKSSIQLWYTKDNTTVPSEPMAIGQVYNTDDHSKWTTVVPTYNATYPYYYYCWQYKYVDNTYGWSTAVFDKATTESEERARTGIADAAAAQATANSNIKSTVQLWRVGSADTPLPSAPISHVTEDRANITNTWTKVVPVYNISNPYYFYCYEYQKGDNTYSWSDVIYDAATTENQANSRSALAQVETKVETSVFNSLKNTVDENSATITSLSTKTETALTRGIEYITGTQTSATNVWTGATQDETLHAGKTIAYKLPYAGNGTGVTLTLTLADGTTTTSPINVYINNTQVTEEYPANSVIKMTYDGHDWRIDNYNSDTNYYDREAYKASVTSSEAIAAGLISVFNTNGTLKKLSNTAFDTSYPILYVGTAYAAANTTQSDNYTFWGTPFNLTNTHTIQDAAAGKPVYIVGSLNGNILTPNSTVLTCTIPTSEDSLFYLRLGLMSSTTEAVLESQHPIYAFFDGKFQQSNPAIVTTMTTTNRIQQTATSNNARITALITTIGTNEDGTPSENPDEDSMLYKVSDIEQNLDGFKTTVSNTYVTNTDFGTRMSAAESNITQNANNIELKVSESNVTGNYLIGKINLDSTTATISADRININGTAVFNSIKDTLDNTYSSTEAAVAEEQRIYYRSNSNTTPTSPGSTWITKTTNTWNTSATVGVNGWSTKITPLADDVGGTKYIYLYTAIQKKTVSGAVTTGAITLDDTTTIIDGGNIVTGSVTANKLNAGDINSSGILTVTAFDSTTQNNILNDKLKIGGVNLIGKFNFSSSKNILTEDYYVTNLNNEDDRTWSYANSDFKTSILEAGVYTLSWKVSSTTTNGARSLRIYDSNNTLIWDSGVNECNFSTLGSYTKTFTLDNNTSIGIMIKIYSGQARFQLEKGVIATDWSKPPEDTSLSIEETTSRTQYDIPIKADLAITREHIICGNALGYHHITAGASFDLAYPILFAGDNIAQNTTSANNYLQYPNITFTTSAAIQDAAANKIVYLKGKINSANTFTFDSGSSAVILTCTVPTNNTDGYFYLPIGILSNATTGYFNSSNALYAYVKDNGFRQVTPSEIIEEQYIYISKASGTLSVNSNSTWVTESSDSQNTWTNTRPTYNTDYPVLFVAKQTKTISGAISCTIPKIDNTTTVIDGGHIITGSIDADKISVSDINALNATIGGFQIDYNLSTNPPSGSIHTKDVAITSNADNSIALSSADFQRRINGTDRSGLRLAIGDKFGVTGDGILYGKDVDVTGTINATSGYFGSSSSNGWAISNNSISHGTLGNSGGYILNASGNSSANINDVNRSNLALAIGSKFGVDKDGTLYANGANITNISIGNTDLEIGSTNLMLNTATLSTGSVNGSGIFSTGTDSSVPSGQYCQFTSTAANTAGPHFEPSTTVTKLGMYNDKMIDGETYTFSAWVMTSANKTLTTVGPEESTSKTYSDRTLVANTWKRVSCTFKNYKAATYRSCPFYISEKLAANEWIRISSLKLERGNVVTDWTEAPEDIVTDISNAAKTATNYITQIDSNGIQIHPSGSPGNYASITSDGMSIVKANTGTIASFSGDTRIGLSTAGNVFIGNTGYITINNGNQTFAHMGHLPGGSSTIILSENAEIGTPYSLPSDMATFSSITLANTTLTTNDYTINNGVLTLNNSNNINTILNSLINIETEENYDEETDQTETSTTTTINPASLELTYVRTQGAGAVFGRTASTAEFAVAIPASFEYPDVVRTHHNTSNRNTGFYAKRDDTGISMFSGIGAGGINHGLWSNTLGKWIIYANASTVHMPEHWVDGRMWISSYAMVQRSYWTTQGSAPSENSYGGFIGIGDNTGVTCYIEALRTTEDIVYNRLVSRRRLGSGNNAVFKSNILDLGVKSDGSCKVWIQGNGAVAAWREALNVVNKSGDTMTGNLIIEKSVPALQMNSTDVIGKIGVSVPSENKVLGREQVYDATKNGTVNDPKLVYYSELIRTSGDVLYKSFVVTRLNSNNENVYNGFYLNINSSGNPTVTFTNGAAEAWRTGLNVLPLTGGTITNDIYIKDSEINRDGNNPSNYLTGKSLTFRDKDSERIGLIRVDRNTDGNSQLILAAYNENTSSAEVNNLLELKVDRAGTRSIYVSDAAIWRTALDINSSKSLSGTNAFTVNSNATLTTAYIRHSNVKVCTIYVKVKLNAKLAIGGTRTIGSIVAGYRPAFDFRLDFGGITGMTGYINSNGVITVGNGTGAEISANSEFYCTGTYVSA